MRIPGLAWTAELDDLPWQETRDRGVFWIPLHLDDPSPEDGSSEEGRRGGATVLIRMDPGCGYAAHRHVGTEDVLVVAGGYRDDLGEHTAGSHVHYPPGSVHAPVALGDPDRPVGASNPPCVLYATVPEGIELLRDAGAS